jgi:Co/Zn/Cd efflux system component
MILLTLHRKHQQAKNHAERKNARMELKLFILTMLMFTNEFTVGIMMVYLQ